MSTQIDINNNYHLGDQIINFIFFYKIKEYIENNNIIINYYCHKEYHKNLLEFNCSNNIKIFDYSDVGYLLWQGTVEGEPKQYIEETLCIMFNTFLKKYNIPITVNEFEYKDDDLINRYNKIDDKYKNIDILIINSEPRSGQYMNYNKEEWDNFIIKLSTKYKIVTSSNVNNNILSLENHTVKDIASVATKIKTIIAINTGPSVSLYNTDILNNADYIYIFSNEHQYSFKTRKIIQKFNKISEEIFWFNENIKEGFSYNINNNIDITNNILLIILIIILIIICYRYKEYYILYAIIYIYFIKLYKKNKKKLCF
jgi:hypothetical protein